jgi:hypothetical protein
MQWTYRRCLQVGTYCELRSSCRKLQQSAVQLFSSSRLAWQGACLSLLLDQ